MCILICRHASITLLRNHWFRQYTSPAGYIDGNNDLSVTMKALFLIIQRCISLCPCQVCVCVSLSLILRKCIHNVYYVCHCVCSQFKTKVNSIIHYHHIIHTHNIVARPPDAMKYRLKSLQATNRIAPKCAVTGELVQSTILYRSVAGELVEIE